VSSDEEAFNALLYIVTVILVYSSAMFVVVIKYLRKRKHDNLAMSENYFHSYSHYGSPV
ncbi:hypothetical protein BgiBS90_012132, partial [Biomphalaria glabrata]